MSGGEHKEDAASGGTYRLKDWYFLTPFALTGFALGMWGFLSCGAKQSCHPNSVGDAAINTLLLIIHAGGSFSRGDAPLPLIIAQTVLPLVLVLGTVSAVTKVVLSNLRHDVRVALVRAMHGHVIVCGLGTTGMEAVCALNRKRGKVVAVSLDPRGEGVRACERLGVPVMIGDAALPKLLDAAGISRARAVVMSTGSDAHNMEICLAIEALTRPASHELLLYPEVRGSWLLETLNAQRTPVLKNGLQLNPFRANEVTARALLRHPVFRNVASEPVVLFAGFGDLASTISRQAALSVYAVPGIRLHANCYDSAAEAQDSATRGAPWRQLVDLTFSQRRLGAAGGVDWIRQDLNEQPPDVVIVTLPDDDSALQTAIGLRNELDALLRFDTPIFVRVRNQLLLGELLRNMISLPLCPYRLVGFGDLGGVVSPDSLFDDQLDAMARAVHEDYLANSTGDSPARLPWSALPERFRRSNRAAADHIPVKLGLAGYRAVSGNEPSAPMDDAAIECMAQAEHYRWCLELKAGGWTQGKMRSDLLKIHPLLVPWEELPEGTRLDNREQIRAMPATLLRAGMRVQRVVLADSQSDIPSDPAVLPLFLLDPTDTADWEKAEAQAGVGECAAMIRRVPGLRAEALEVLQQKYPKLAQVITGWRNQ